MQAEFPLLKPVSDSESKVLCAFCNAKIDIAFGGRLCITRHVETRTPDWEKNVVPAAEFVLKHHPLASIKMDELYDEHTLLQQYVDKSLGRWVALPTEGRWLELLKSLNEEHRAIPNFSMLAQYALAIPGTSTEVERLFSIIKDVWGPQEGHLDPKTLEARLNIKFNSKKSCSEYFNDVKSNKRLLSQVQGGEKYKNVGDSQHQRV